MIVTATEFKTNLGKYLEMATSQDIFITKNGKRRAERKQDSAGASEAGDSYGASGDQPDRGGKSAGVY